MQNAEGYDLHWSILWKIKVPAKIKLFMWQALHQILPTLCLIENRGIQVNTSCRWCNEAPENFKHLLWECSLARQCWNFFYS